MSERFFYQRCPLISISEFYSNNVCMGDDCVFWDGQTDEDKPKGKCVLVRAAYALSTHER